MTRGGASADWRSAGVVEALSRHLEAAPPVGPVLVMADTGTGAASLFEGFGVRVARWSRRVSPGAIVSGWPPPGPSAPSAFPGEVTAPPGWSVVALRLSRAKDELEMLVNAAASVLDPGGALLVYGAKDEGIRSAASRIEPVFGPVETVSVKSRCRVLRARRPEEIQGLRGELAAWRSTWRLRVEGRGSPGTVGLVDRPWVSYPGVFSHGRLDAGTRLLLEAVDAPAEGARVLDYGCGSGVIGGVLAARSVGLRLLLLDADAIALEAAGENVPEGRTILASGLEPVEDVPFDLIVSNPPYHRGKTEDRRVLDRLVERAPSLLRSDGALEMVVQRRFPVEESLAAGFGRVRVLAEDATYRVWRGEEPR